MRKLLLLLLVTLACGLCNAERPENVKRYYDNSSIECTVALPKNISKMNLLWQLITPYGRVMAQGQIQRKPNESFVTVPLKFDELEAGISLKCALQIKVQGRIIGKQNLIIYSKKIFADIAGKLKKLNSGAVLPHDQIAGLNELGLDLSEKPLENLENPANKLIFCEAKKYCDNVEMLKFLMNRELTLVMLAPDDESEIFVPMQNFSEIYLISSKNAKTKSGLGVICNKEKISVTCAGGQGGLVEVKYKKGRIIVVSDSVCKALDKIPEAALMLKQTLIK